MKKIAVIIFALAKLFFFSNCSTTVKKKVSCENYEIMRFDLDSNLLFAIPKNWDSVDNHLFWSPEYKYYVDISDRKKTEGIEIKRLKFRDPELNLLNQATYLKNGVLTTSSYSPINLLQESTKEFKNQTIGILLFSLKRSGDTFYWARVYFINKDSSNTTIDIRTTDIDSAVSYKKINCILNSLKYESK